MKVIFFVKIISALSKYQQSKNTCALNMPRVNYHKKRYLQITADTFFCDTGDDFVSFTSGG